MKIQWNTGRRIVELGELAKGLAACDDCGQLLNLANTTGKRLHILLAIRCLTQWSWVEAQSVKPPQCKVCSSPLTSF